MLSNEKVVKIDKIERKIERRVFWSPQCKLIDLANVRANGN